MEERTYAKECGLRCSRLRMAQGMSQQELAEKVFTTAQNISKYEKNGISNIDMIHKISDALGHDILVDETDTEGVVGEIGKEILRILIMEGGNKAVHQLAAEDMYGMNTSRINQEIFKLEHIGMCVREQYVGFDDKTHDYLFITAKGIITYKNIIGRSIFNTAEQNALLNVISYEQLIKDSDSYQDFVNKREAEKLIRSIYSEENGEYRINYIEYLKANYEEGFEEDDGKIDATRGNIIPHSGFYTDLIYRMAMHYTRDFYDALLMEGGLNPDEELEFDELADKVSDRSSDAVIFQADTFFKSKFQIIKDIVEHPDYDPDPDLRTPKYIYDRYFALAEKGEDAEKHYFSQNKVFFESYEEADQEGLLSPYPTRWFSADDIKEFIQNNLIPAQTEAEKKLDDILRRVNELNPATLNYYRFPLEWEENGLANMVRDIYGIGK